MSFYNEILARLSITPEESIGGTKITVVDFRGVLIEGHKGLYLYSEDEISVNLKKSRITLRGKGLHFSEINGDEIYITGEIKEIVRE